MATRGGDGGGGDALSSRVFPLNFVRLNLNVIITAAAAVVVYQQTFIIADMKYNVV